MTDDDDWSTPDSAVGETRDAMADPRSTSDEPRLALPTARLVLAAILTAGACAGGWWLTAWLAGWTASTARAGVGGAGVVGLAMIASLVAIAPWKVRPMSVWMSAWLASMLLRLLITPVGAYLLYSAALLSPEPLAVSVALAYLLSLLSRGGCSGPARAAAHRAVASRGARTLSPARLTHAAGR